MKIQVKHIKSKNEAYRFKVCTMDRNPITTNVKLESPQSFRNNEYSLSLTEGLQWYLETYPELPATPNKDKAVAILSLLERWGNACFSAIFNSHTGLKIFYTAAMLDINGLHIEIVSSDPHVLSWPWEALYNDMDGFIFEQAKINRSLVDYTEKQYEMDTQARQLSILYILSRKENDKVGFQTVARPLVDFIKEGGWSVQVDVLRPATKDNLKAALQAKSYHIVHFDGHGNNEKGKEYLYFEHENQPKSYDYVSGCEFANIITQHNVPYVVLNACRSAMATESHFSSVAVRLLKAGINGVVAMGYKLRVSSAKRFVPVFYKKLFENGSMSDALTMTRQEMYNSNTHHSLHDGYEYSDWLIPVLYGHATQPLPKIEPSKPTIKAIKTESLEKRDKEQFALERALRKEPAGIIVHGMTGEGKTALVYDFIQWLEATNSPFKQYIWVDFANYRTADSIKVHMAEKLNVPIYALVNILQKESILTVWDNFEVNSAFKDKQQLDDLLCNLFNCSSKSKVIITSRTDEHWMCERACKCKITLDGRVGDGAVAVDDNENPLDSSIADLLVNAVPMLRLLGLHDEYVGSAYIADMLNRLGLIALDVKGCFSALLNAGFCHKDYQAGENIAYKLHPALLSGLKQQYPAQKDEREVFAVVMANTGMQLLKEETSYNNKLRLDFESNFLNALHIANELRLRVYKAHLTAIQAGFAHRYDNLDESKRLYIEATAILEACSEGKQAAPYYLELGILEEKTGYYDSASLYYAKAMLRSQASDVETHIKALAQKGNLNFNMGKWDEAYAMYEKLIHAEHTTGITWSGTMVMDKATAYFNMGFIKKEQGQYEQARRHFNENLCILNTANESVKELFFTKSADTYYQLGQIEMDCKNSKMAERQFERAFQRYNHSEGKANVHYMLGILYLEKEDFYAVEQHLIEAFNHCYTLKQDARIGLACALLAATELKNGSTVSARNWALEAVSIFEQCTHNELVTANVPVELIDAMKDILAYLSIIMKG